MRSTSIMASWNSRSLREGQLWQVLLILMFFGVTDVVGVHASGQCVQLGQANINRRSNNTWPLDVPVRYGYWTIGTKKFDVTHVFLDNSITNYAFDANQKDCPYKGTGGMKFYLNLCPGNEVKIDTYAVFQDGVIMNGWLHFEIVLTDKSDEIMGIYVQIRDEYYNAIGEFVLPEDEQCPSNTPDLAQPSQYQVLPCSSVGYREAKVANALFMVQPDLLKYRSQGERYLSRDSIARGIHFTWKMSEYWCNRHLRIRPEAIIITKKMVINNQYDPWGKCPNPNKPRCPVSPPYRKAAEYWIFPGWFGAADIKKQNTKLDCSTKVIDYDTGKYTTDGSGKNVASWFLEAFVSTNSKIESRPLKSGLLNDYMYNTYSDASTSHIDTIQSCHANTRLSIIGELGGSHKGHKIPSFAGRCTHHFKKTPSHDALPGCNLDGSAPEFQNLPDNLKFENYTAFVNVLTVNRTKLCSVPCYPPNSTADVEAIKSYNDTSGEGQYVVKTTYNSASRNEARVEKLWIGRKYHAILCTIWTMFLCPIGIFAARYFKETCMAFTCTGIHLWYLVHVLTALTALWMFLSSISGLWSNLTTWGRSIHPWGTQHRVVGYLSVSAFTLMLMFGGFRPGADTGRRCHRIAFLFFHSMCGFAIYIFNVYAIMISTLIPASPSMDQCDEEGNSASTSRVLIMAIVWLVMDIGFHIVMTSLYLMVDRRVQITRPWYCPIVPILSHDSTSDLAGASVRKIIFLVYIGASFIMTTTTVAMIGDNELNETCKNLTGPTDCEGDQRIYGCSGYVKAYIKYIMEQSEKNDSGTYGSNIVEFV